MPRRPVLAALAATLAASFLAQGSAGAATLVADYRFQDTLASSVSDRPDISNVGGGNRFVTETVGCTPTRVLSFPKGSGVQLRSPTREPDDYSVVVLFRIAETSGYRRILAPSSIEPPNFNTDNGLYNFDGRLAAFDTKALGVGVGPNVVFGNNTYAEVAFIYDDIGAGPQTAGYVNGTEQFSYPSTDAHVAVYMRFFKDNDSGGATNEDSAGAVARIRIYAGDLTPGEVAAIHAASPIAGACDPTRRARAAVNGKVKVKRGPNGRFIVITGIEVGCPDLGAACEGSASIRRGGGSGKRARISRAPKQLGKKKLSVAAGKSEKVKVKLTRKASAALREKGKLKAKISVKLAPPGTPAAVASRNATLKPPKPKHSES